MSAMLIAIMAGGALALGLLAVFRLWSELGQADATYRDRPSIGFRILWPVINVFGNTFGPLLGARRQQACLQKLRQAGQEYALTPQQFQGAKIAGLLITGVLAAMLDGGENMWVVAMGCLLGFFYPDIWLKEHTKKRNLAILKSLPFFLDIVTLSVESGLNLTGAMQKAVDRCKPGPLIVEINRVLREVRAGKPRVEALRDLADRLDSAPISSLVAALVQGELMGSSLGPVLRAQSDQRRIERFQRAEKLAMEAPVKMLGPLILFIFPCTFVIIGFPIVMKFMASGL